MAKNVDVIVFKGIKFRRYPDAAGLADQRYYVPGIADRQRGVKRLHEEIWMAEHGQEIPVGHHIHHQDGNHLNNSPSNLTCITKDEHLAHHGEQPRSETQRAWWAEYQQRAAAWHGSDEGRAWHSEHGKQTWVGREHREALCQQCGQAYSTRTSFDNDRFCSNKCKSAARRASGLDDEERTCALCSSTFVVNRYKKTRFCSRSCGRRSRLA